MKFSPSLMCMDPLEMGRGIRALGDKVDFYHIDIMDGHFVPNLAMCPSQVAALSAITQVPLDCHLMVERPEDYVGQLIQSGAGYISLQAETLSGQAFRLISLIHQAGRRAGVVLNPETPLEMVRHYLPLLDKLTIMTVDPGFAGQPFIPQMVDKIRQARSFREEGGYRYLIEADGACNEDTYKTLTKAGADVMVMGSTGLFKLHPDLSVAWERMLAIYEQALH